MRTIVIGAVVFGAMLLEARRAWRNEREQRARGGVEPAGDVYPLMQIAYPAAFAAMLVEGAVREPVARGTFLSGAIVFAAAKALKYWAIATLGRFWTFRVIVVPGAGEIAAGPYRFLRHPNYVGVVGELVGVALMTGAVRSGPIGTIAFAALIVRRVAVEAAALRHVAAWRGSVAQQPDASSAGGPGPD